MKTGLVLEGGGLRATYTVGVLDLLMDENIMVDYCIGVSAGACHGVSYVSGQRGRGLKVALEYAHDPRYLSLGNYIKTRSVFGMDFVFRQIPDELVPFDYDAFHTCPCEFVTGVTDVRTGKPFYFTKDAIDRDVKVLEASSSIPVFSPPVEINGGMYLDGGTTDAIPMEKAFQDGCEKVVVVLTRHRAYRKDPEGMRAVYQRVFRRQPEMIQALNNRHRMYNQTLARLMEREKEGTALVIAPRSPLKVGRFETKPDKLQALYDLGYNDAQRLGAKIKQFLK